MLGPCYHRNQAAAHSACGFRRHGHSAAHTEISTDDQYMAIFTLVGQPGAWRQPLGHMTRSHQPGVRRHLIQHHFGNRQRGKHHLPHIVWSLTREHALLQANKAYGCIRFNCGTQHYTSIRTKTRRYIHRQHRQAATIDLLYGSRAVRAHSTVQPRAQQRIHHHIACEA